MFHFPTEPQSAPVESSKYATATTEVFPPEFLRSVETKAFKRGKSPRKRQKRSVVWLYFKDDDNDENAAVCLICATSVPRGRNLARNTTNLRKHLEHRHKELFLNSNDPHHRILPHEVTYRKDDTNKPLDDILPLQDPHQINQLTTYSQPLVMPQQSLPQLNTQLGLNTQGGSSQFMGAAQFGGGGQFTGAQFGAAQFGVSGYGVGHQQMGVQQQWQQAYQINGMVQQVQQLQLDVRQADRLGMSELFVTRLEGKREEMELQHGVYSG